MNDNINNASLAILFLNKEWPSASGLMTTPCPLFRIHYRSNPVGSASWWLQSHLPVRCSSTHPHSVALPA